MSELVNLDAEIATIDANIQMYRNERRAIAAKGLATAEDLEIFLSIGRYINTQQLKRDQLASNL